MDTLTHLALGLAVASLSGHPFSLHDPVYLAALLGAEAPDLDIVSHLRGPWAYLKTHRLLSHSLPGLLVWSLLIGLVLYLYGHAFTASFMWAACGCFSHIIFDYFNTHGASVAWPWQKQRLSEPLLKVFDPILLCLIILPFLLAPASVNQGIESLCFAAAYVLLQYQLRYVVKSKLQQHYKNQAARHIYIMPSLNHGLCWDYIVQSEQKIHLGNYTTLSGILTENKVLPMSEENALLALGTGTRLDQFFQFFTPYPYYFVTKTEASFCITISDLRYTSPTGFIHWGFMHFNQNKQLETTYLFTYKQKILIAP
ncbi:MAG: metal-dependent hydrolase [Sporomusaceae bacterium]|nr:metal-dependent hydrolase [Sporomusaceae bacterium]